MELPENKDRFVPVNRKQRRLLAKAYKGFQPKRRNVWQTINKHMKINAASKGLQISPVVRNDEE